MSSQPKEKHFKSNILPVVTLKQLQSPINCSSMTFPKVCFHEAFSTYVFNIQIIMIEVSENTSRYYSTLNYSVCKWGPSTCVLSNPVRPFPPSYDTLPVHQTPRRSTIYSLPQPEGFFTTGFQGNPTRPSSNQNNRTHPFTAKVFFTNQKRSTALPSFITLRSTNVIININIIIQYAI